MDSPDASPYEPIDPNANAPLVPPPPSAPRTNVFIGPHGLRAGWKWLLFILVLSALIFCFGFALTRILRPPAPHTQPSLRLMFSFEAVQALCVLLATGVMAKLVDKKPWGYFGLPLNRAFASEFWIGAVVGFGALFVQLSLMRAGGWFEFGPMVLHGGEILKWGALWGVFFVCVGFFEEGFLRGYPQRVLTNGMGFWPAALLLSVLFGALHLGNKGENGFGIFMVFVDGMTMCFSLWRTGNMWFAVGNHAAWDWAQSYFFGTPDSGQKPIGALFSPSFHGPKLLSGGTAGPEGSILVLLSEALIVVAIAAIYRTRKYPLPSDEELTAPAIRPAPVTPAPLPNL
jgi:uncharacterized protein